MALESPRLYDTTNLLEARLSFIIQHALKIQLKCQVFISYKLTCMIVIINKNLTYNLYFDINCVKYVDQLEVQTTKGIY